MSNNIGQHIYSTSPAFLQNIFLNVYACKIHKERYGSKFRRVKSEIERTQWSSQEEIDQYQNYRLRQLIRHAYDTVPYYKTLFDTNGIEPDDIKSKNDLYKIPLLTKEDVRGNAKELLSSKYRKSQLVHGHTSGTTGSPLEFYWDINTCVYTNAVDWRQKNWAGVKYGNPIAVLLGRTIVPIKNNKPPFWRMNYLHNQLWLSSFHMSKENLPHYLQKLKTFRPVAIEGYPSTVYILAQYLMATGQTFPLKAVLTSSETLFPIQREIIEKAFECNIFDFYGLAERVLFATECDAHSGLHLNFEYGITEVVDESNSHLADGASGTIVGTSLCNFAMPFIRYKTSDISSIRKASCSCGRSMPIIEPITTKAEDIVVRPDGRMISPSVLTHPFKPMHNIEKSQIIQEDENNIRIKIVKRSGYTDADTNMLLNSFCERVGDDIKITVEFVSDIPRTASGKYRWIISKVPLLSAIRGK